MVLGRILAIPGCDRRIFGSDWVLGREPFITFTPAERSSGSTLSVQPWFIQESVKLLAVSNKRIISQPLLFGLPPNTTQDFLDKPGKKEKKAA